MFSVTGDGMVGRVLEREAIERVVQRVLSGGSGCVWIEGEAGIGKTRLADWFCSEVSFRSATLFRGRIDELDRGRPFGPLGDALGVVPDGSGGPSSGSGAAHQVIDQFVERVEVIALKNPVAVVVEDLHWGDAGTIIALRAILRRLSHLPVAVLGTFRPWPRPAELVRLIESSEREGAVLLNLGPLDGECVVDLACELLGARLGAGLGRQLTATAGNPLFIRELVGALSADQAIRVVDGVADIDGDSLPPSLRLTILRRIGALGEVTVSLLRVASVLGSEFSLDDVATVSNRRVAGVVDGLLAARRAGVIEEVGDHLRFRHDLLRSALYDDLPASARRALHRDAGRRLAATGAPKLRVAEQMSLGAETGDREAVRWLVDAARQAILRAPVTAVALLERAEQIVAPDDPARDELLAELAEALVWSGDPDRAQSLALRLLARGVRAPIRDRARSTAVRGLWMAGRWRELVDCVDRWISDAPLPDIQRAPLLADLAMACAFSGEVDRAEGLALESLSIGEALTDDSIIFRALYPLSAIANFRGDHAAELAASERALAITERGENPDLVRFHPHFAHAMSLNGNDRYEDAERMLRLGMRLREELGTVWDLPLYQAGLADLHCQLGRWDDALIEAETGVLVAEEVGTRIGVVVCCSIAALICAHRGEPDQAERQLATARQEIERSGPQWGLYWAILAQVQISEARGDSAGALTELSDAWDSQSHSPGLQVYLGPELVRLALVHDVPRAHAVADAVAAHAEGMTVAGAKGSALVCRGRVEHDPDLLERAAATFRESGWRFELAGAHESAAGAHATRGDLTAARAAFNAALAIYEEIGARRDTARALGAMRACGFRPGSRAAHRRALAGWDALTPMENDVVEWCVEGLTNREIGERLFISRRTVQTHLAHAFTKLDVASRVELAAGWARRGGPTQEHNLT